MCYTKEETSNTKLVIIITSQTGFFICTAKISYMQVTFLYEIPLKNTVLLGKDGCVGGMHAKLKSLSRRYGLLSAYEAIQATHHLQPPPPPPSPTLYITSLQSSGRSNVALFITPFHTVHIHVIIHLGWVLTLFPAL
jgi:hypothetical protein